MAYSSSSIVDYFTDELVLLVLNFQQFFFDWPDYDEILGVADNFFVNQGVAGAAYLGRLRAIIELFDNKGLDHAITLHLDFDFEEFFD